MTLRMAAAGKILVTKPHLNTNFNRKAKDLAGRWNGTAWDSTRDTKG